MKCLNPKRVYVKALGKVLYTACGRCSHCLENRREQWLFRLDTELSYSVHGFHLTLQYDDDHLGDNILNKRDLQLFIKRLRYFFNFTYYGIGEYGTSDRRKHMHLAVFLKTPIHRHEFFEKVRSEWPYGFVYITPLSHNRMAYVLHYHVRPKIVDDKPTFQVFSKGLGSMLLDDDSFRDYCLANNTVCITNRKGKFIPLPRYYRKKLGYQMTEQQTRDVKTIYDDIANYYHVPKSELNAKQISTYLQVLFLSDVKRLLKYNNQIKI